MAPALGRDRGPGPCTRGQQRTGGGVRNRWPVGLGTGPGFPLCAHARVLPPPGGGRRSPRLPPSDLWVVVELAGLGPGPRGRPAPARQSCRSSILMGIDKSRPPAHLARNASRELPDLRKRQVPESGHLAAPESPSLGACSTHMDADEAPAGGACLMHMGAEPLRAPSWPWPRFAKCVPPFIDGPKHESGPRLVALHNSSYRN